MKKINSLEELKEVLSEEGETVEGYILLKGGIRSSKSMCKIGNDQYSIINEVDDTEDILTLEEFNDNTKTNIGDAIAKGIFFLYGE